MPKMINRSAVAEADVRRPPLTEERPRAPRPRTRTLVAALTDHLADLGVENAFGVSGGAIALFFDSLAESPIRLHHFRHETGAAFAATEAFFASGKPALVFATTGPGLLNALTGVTAARFDGAKLILVSGSTSAAQRGRWAVQETTSHTMPQDYLYGKGPLFDYAIRIEHECELPEVARRVALGLSRPGRFVAHICLPMALQGHHVDLPSERRPARISAPAASPADVEHCAELLRDDGPFAIWVGFGATAAASRVRKLVESTGAKVFCSPRAKGVVSELHPQTIGTSGLGGHDSVTRFMIEHKPRWLLVLGSRLGETTSFWDRDMLPEAGLIHVDIDPDVPGTAFPDAHTIGIEADVGQFVDALLEHFPASHAKTLRPRFGDASSEPVTMLPIPGRGPVRPQVLMQAIQRRVVMESDAVVLSECGNAFAWCNHYLRFSQPGRYRVSTLFGSMGHCATGVVGAALASGKKAVAVVGDGSMLMSSEISSAAQYRARAVWIVLNDAGYGMCRDGHRALGLDDTNFDVPRVEFVDLARALGADGVRVESEDMVDVAVQDALRADGPFVVDVRIDPSEASPLLRRFDSLIKQGNSKNIAGWDR